ncbi:hypothetical protein EXE59_10165 [Nocardioides eburneiflavus]|uniref:Uncharacterized protein n=1 Tax=Nocardioides eburneiflavus TaxID=2518372 RepID=A0A4Z1C212_9ACTN|nr:hypothetical protein [Nocardioides eburneiflavus]TGN64274.1 hypothetical protein EXE59_10165 [Nocardioides eburneiflavus]
MHITWRALVLLVAITSGMLALSGCEQVDPSAASGAKPAPSSATTQSESAGATATAVPANLLHVCDHVQDAFRSGSLDDAAQNRALASELQGMIDVADPDAAQMLRPMAEAAAAIGADGRSRAAPRLQRAQGRAYRALRRTCISAGSQAWNQH